VKKVLAVLLLVGCCLARPAAAGLTQDQLAEVGVVPPPDARAPLALPFRDEAGRGLTLAEATRGRPAVLLLADYTCADLCGAATTLLASLLDRPALRPGTDYAALVVGLDPRDGPTEAAAAKARELAAYPKVAETLPFLSGDAAAVRALVRAVGYRYAYDPGHDRFAHPATLLVLGGDGRVVRALSSLAAEPRDLRLALVEAGGSGAGTLADRVRLLCYGFDPVQGVYTPAVLASLRLAALATVVGLGGGLVLLRRRERTAAR
jgi:protein SCO1/2